MEIDANKLRPQFQENDEGRKLIDISTHNHIMDMIREKHQTNHMKPATIVAFEPSKWIAMVRTDVEVYGMEGKEMEWICDELVKRQRGVLYCIDIPKQTVQSILDKIMTKGEYTVYDTKIMEEGSADTASQAAWQAYYAAPTPHHRKLAKTYYTRLATYKKREKPQGEQGSPYSCT